MGILGLNHKSLNRYAYVGNNPLASTDPSGLVRCPYAQMACGDGDDLGGGCQIDGVDGSCSVAQTVLGMRAASACPQSGCNYYDDKGKFMTFRAFADGSAGFLPVSGGPPGASVQDIANAQALASTANGGPPIDRSQLKGQAAVVYDLLVELGVSPQNITIYQNGTQGFAAVLTDEGFDQLERSHDADSGLGDAFLHYPYTDGGRSCQSPSLHFVWFDQSLTNYVGGNGVYMQFHEDSGNPRNGGFWQHWGCDVFGLTCH
jgi:hypothetical protein